MSDHRLTEQDRRLGRWLFGVVAVFVAARGLRLHAHDLYRVIGVPGDGWGYYQYIASLFGSHRFAQMPWTHHLDGDHFLSMFTCGVAYLQLPWALLGHLLAWVTGSPMDGYSAPYVVSLFIGLGVYMGLAANLLFRTLRMRFPTHLALAVPLLLLAGTNLYYYASREPAMSHAYMYLVFSVLVHLVERNLAGPSPWRTAGILITCSLAVLIRQLHVVIVLYPLLHGAHDRTAVTERLRWLTQRPGVVLAGAFVAVLLWVPQSFYWHAVTGKWFVFTYGYKGEHFDHMTDPHFGGVLWSVRNGWLVYSPLVLLGLVGLFLQARHKVHGARTTLLILVLVLYGYAAWWCWWLGGAYGHRGFVEYLTLLAAPMAWCLEHIGTWRPLARVPLQLLLMLLVVVNLNLAMRYEWGWSEPGWTWSRLGAEWAALF